MKLGPVTLPLRMTIARLNDGGLWVHSPTELRPELKAEVDGLGRVDSILAPIGFKDICLAPPLRFKFMVKDRPAFVAFVNAVKSEDFERIIVTHGDIIEEDARATLARLCQRFNQG